jgi:hypothetical protein
MVAIIGTGSYMPLMDLNKGYPMNNSTSVLIFFMLLTVLISGCSGGMLVSSGTPSKLEPISKDEEISPTVDICTPLDIPDIAFPRQEYVQGAREVMEAELIGDLVVSDGCLRIESLYGNQSYTPVWPPEFTVVLKNDIPVILDSDGQLVGRIGEEIYMGGGESSESGLPACVRQQMPPTCSGKYWIVGEGVRLNLKFDSELFDMDLVPAVDRMAILLKKAPILDEWTGEPDTVTGILRFYNPDRCPRIQSESGTSNYLPIWPQGYSLQFAENRLEILNIDGNVVARQDESVTLEGSLVPTNWENPNYRQLRNETPGDCIGPYWIVYP